MSKRQASAASRVKNGGQRHALVARCRAGAARPIKLREKPPASAACALINRDIRSIEAGVMKGNSTVTR